MKRGWLVIFVLLPFLVISCNRKKETEEELTPMNAVEKYGGVMSKTLKKSKAMDDVLYMKNKINTFQIQEGRYPKLPEPPKGMAFHYDPSTGKVEVR